MAKRKMTDREKWDAMDKAIANSPEYKRMLKALGNGSEADGKSLLDIMLMDTMRRMVREGKIVKPEGIKEDN